MSNPRPYRRPHARHKEVNKIWRRNQLCPTDGTYDVRVTAETPLPDDVRRDQFAEWVQDITKTLRKRGMSVNDIWSRGAIGKSTYYRWRGGDWSDGEPDTKKVADFCIKLGLDQNQPIAILVGGRRPERPEPQPIRPALEAVQQQLDDPTVPAAVKDMVESVMWTMAEQAARSKRNSATG